VAEFNTERSIRSDGSILATAAGVNADIGGRIAHVWVPDAGGPLSTLDLLGDGLTLFAGPDWDGPVHTPDAGSPPVTVKRLDVIARGLGLTAAGSLLARPDGYPIALWNGEQPGQVRLARAIAAGGASAAPAADVSAPARMAARSDNDAALVAAAGS
jgi:putative polyketide hydroxylase